MKYTLTVIKKELDKFIGELDELVNLSEKDYHTKLNQLKNNVVERLHILSLKHPMMVPVDLHLFAIEQIIENISRDSNNRVHLPIIPIGTTFDYIQGIPFQLPQYINWQVDDNPKKNFIFTYNDKDNEITVLDKVYELILTIMLALPPKSVKVNVVDLRMSGVFGFLVSGLHKELRHEEVVLYAADFDTMLLRLKQRLNDFISEYGSLETYNKNNGKIAEPYELVLLPDFPDYYKNYYGELELLLQYGSKAGIYFIGIKKQQDSKSSIAFSQYCNVFNQNDFINHSHIESNGLATAIIPLLQINGFAPKAFEYLNKECKDIEKEVYDGNEMYKQVVFLSKEMVELKDSKVRLIEEKEEQQKEIEKLRGDINSLNIKLANVISGYENKLTRVTSDYKNQISKLTEEKNTLTNTFIDEKNKLADENKRLFDKLNDAKEQMAKDNEMVRIYLDYYCNGRRECRERTIRNDEYNSLLRASQEYLQNYVSKFYPSPREMDITDVSIHRSML